MNAGEIATFLLSAASLITAIGALAAFLRFRAQNRKDDSEAGKHSADAYKSVSEGDRIRDDINQQVFSRMEVLLRLRDADREQMEKRITALEKKTEEQAAEIKRLGQALHEREEALDDLEDEFRELQRRFSEAMKGTRTLIAQIRESNKTPRWVPPDYWFES